ncbi:hypothetical protein FH508_0011295 [Lysinibacillus sp. CD3-6]|nr:hypothetical protein [Lysinibacillus sp. CD3-6]UED82451.1 hypothetical protein FH508_0011295 [Lysinibacillus sp. CD3-6]
MKKVWLLLLLAVLSLMMVACNGEGAKDISADDPASNDEGKGSEGDAGGVQLKSVFLHP